MAVKKVKTILIVLVILLVAFYICSIKVYNWAGVWSTTYDEMRLDMNGFNVQGPYAYQDGYAKGKIYGFRFPNFWGKKLKIQWTEKIDEGQTDSGMATLEISKDSQNFTGVWDRTDTQDGSEWTGDRVSDNNPNYVRLYRLIFSMIGFNND